MRTKSRQKILQELSGKGVDRATALAAWEAAAEVEQPDELAVLRATVQKKCQPDSALDEKAMRRLQGFLLRRGFSYGDISHVLDEMHITCERNSFLSE